MEGKERDLMFLVGGVLQMWRMNDLIHMPEEEALAEIREFRDKVA